MSWSESPTTRELVSFVQRSLARVADPVKAAAMAAYMKTDMPFYGVQKPERAPIARDAVRGYPPGDEGEYRERVLALWSLPHREEKYIALDYADQKRFVTPAALPLYERLIREGAWWDFVDFIASHLVGGALLRHRAAVQPVLDAWIEDRDLWIRRAAILAQLRHKGATDAERLFRYCRMQAHETEFFIRKAIGWALREYSKWNPEAVKAFLTEHRRELSGLSLREGAKHLAARGWTPPWAEAG